MRRLFVTALCLIMAVAASAVPAKKGKIPVTLDDGSVIMGEVHGDEFHSWITDASGRKLSEIRAPKLRRDEVTSARRPRNAGSEMTLGTHRIPVILVNFQDVKFKTVEPATKFAAMLNEPGYSANRGTGSVNDYYKDNSKGQYDPVFDIYGPVTVSSKMAVYGHKSGDKADLAIYQAALQLDGEIDFSKYDSDHDGEVDMILMYYAGFNPAEGGSSDAIWPHQYFMSYSGYKEVAENSFDGVRLNRYFCTSELKGTSGSTMCGIGTTCHEFAHSLGLPDFYDTDENDPTPNEALSVFSLMCSGPYNNDGNTPPYLNALEREMLGWAESPEEITEDGFYSLKSISENQSYKTSSNVPGEFFIYECRDGSGWDKYIGVSGLVVYHVDQSDRVIADGRTAAYMWDHWTDYNDINSIKGHPLFDIVHSTSGEYLSYYVFPGYNNVRKLTPLDWDDNSHGFTISDIAYSNKTVSFNATFTREDRAIRGTVVTYAGKALKDAEIRLYKNTGAGKMSMIPGTPPILESTVVATTNNKGEFNFSLSPDMQDDYILSVHKAGYAPISTKLELDRGQKSFNFTLHELGQVIDVELSKVGNGNYYTMVGTAAGVKFSADELAPYAGMPIASISYNIVSNPSSVRAVIQFGGESKVYSVPASSVVFGKWATIDVSSLGLKIPSGKDGMFGIFTSGTGSEYTFLIQGSNEKDACYSSMSTSYSSIQWTRENGYAASIKVGLQGPEVINMAAVGVNTIASRSSYKAGEKFVFLLDEAPARKPSSVKWSFDSVAKTESFVTLTSGSHTVEALLEYPDGTEELLILEIEVK